MIAPLLVVLVLAGLAVMIGVSALIERDHRREQQRRIDDPWENDR